ncbi:hypothetical protein EVAR_93500_1 [Eumeta japonica]|uniref:Uncharacterized protein n=1 Tax=Eumeta variegata TaxID=151549 RepID=A0A4C1TM06_EUMVA|nr:hypothetical protein EVAR_93500_1 [Eumeta japonica]
MRITHPPHFPPRRADFDFEVRSSIRGPTELTSHQLGPDARGGVDATYRMSGAAGERPPVKVGSHLVYGSAGRYPARRHARFSSVRENISAALTATSIAGFDKGFRYEGILSQKKNQSNEGFKDTGPLPARRAFSAYSPPAEKAPQPCFRPLAWATGRYPSSGIKCVDDRTIAGRGVGVCRTQRSRTARGQRDRRARPPEKTD